MCCELSIYNAIFISFTKILSFILSVKCARRQLYVYNGYIYHMLTDSAPGRAHGGIAYCRATDSTAGPSWCGITMQLQGNRRAVLDRVLVPELCVFFRGTEEQCSTEFLYLSFIFQYWLTSRETCSIDGVSLLSCVCVTWIAPEP